VAEGIQDTGAVGAARNTPARISVWAAFLGVVLIAGIFLTPMFWLLYGGTYTFLVFAFGVVAIPAGHLGRRRGKRLGGRDRGAALFGIVTGWILIFFSLLLVLAYVGLLAGLAFLADSAS
jgi:membrane protease YdiL (CAAX protease family)